MRKWFVISVIGVVALVLAACGNESAEDVYSKAMDAAEEMESAEATMDMTQTMDFGDEGSMDVDSSYDMEMTMDPLAMHMDGTTSIGGDDDTAGMSGLGDMDMELYMVDDMMYMYNGMMGSWMKMDGADVDMIEELAGQQPDPAEQIEMIEDYMDDISFEESDDAYVLTLKADGDEFDELFQEMLEENMSGEMLGEMGAEEQEMLDNMEIHSMSMEIGIDKDSYDMKTYDVDMDMTMKIAGEEMNISQTLKSEYSNINNVDPIEVPDDVKDEAVEQGEMGF